MGETGTSIELRPEFWASVSGGKDSLYMLKLILSYPDRYPLHGVVHFELEIDYPFIKNVIDYMEAECKKHGIRFWRIKPRRKWADLIKERGFPTWKVRWCNGDYKLDCDRQLREWLKRQNVKPIMYIGFCADEQRRFKNDLFDRDAKYIYPLAEFGIEEETILRWAKGQKIFNGFYNYNRRCGCMWCPMMTIAEGAYLKKFYPEHYKVIMQAARERERELSKQYGKQVSVWHGTGRYDTDYRERIIEEKYMDGVVNRQMDIYEMLGGNYEQDE